MMTLGWPSHILRQGQIFENATTRFYGKFWQLWPKNGIYSCLNENMKICKGEGHFFTFDLGLSYFASFKRLIKSH